VHYTYVARTSCNFADVGCLAALFACHELKSCTTVSHGNF
jgi:hypothetical protein